MTLRARSRRWAAVALAAGATLAALAPASPAAAAPTQAPPAPIQGRGSSYVAPAMTQWTAAVFPRGYRVGYLPTNSPDGLGQYKLGSVDYAGTEAEFPSLLGAGTDAQVTRGFQYVPDVGGAVAIMYNVVDRAGQKVNYLRLRRQTVARIFIGQITNWSDPAITADLGGRIVLPDKPIEVVFRAGPSGTTALFYDFVQHMIPNEYAAWAARNRYPTGVRLIDPGTSPRFAPVATGLQGSDQMAQHVARTTWSITYDEYAYAKQYGVNVAWIENANGEFVQPYPGNISAALESARLNPDLTQNLEQVYNSRAGGAYPISSYSYLVTQCEGTVSARANCRGGYADDGKARTLHEFMMYVACEGQVQMEHIGYSPLPPVLSQEMANSAARMQGTQPVQLNQGNCANPRFDPNYHAGAPPPPPQLPPPTAPGGGPGEGGPGTGPGAGEGGEGAGGAGRGSTTSTTAASGPEESAAAPGREGANQAIGGGSGTWRDDDPISYRGPGSSPVARWAMVALCALLVLPVLLGGLYRRARLIRGG